MSQRTMRNERTQHIYMWLTYLGITPFLLCAVAPWVGISTLPIVGNIETILKSYTLLILSFMAGTHWGQSLAGNPTPQRFVASTAVTLMAWFGYLALSHNWFIGLSVVLFLWLLLIDHKLYQNQQQSRHYYLIRVRTTVAVSACLLFAMIR